MLPTARKGSRHGDFHFKIDEAQLHELKNVGAAGGCVMSGMMHV